MISKAVMHDGDDFASIFQWGTAKRTMKSACQMLEIALLVFHRGFIRRKEWAVDVIILYWWVFPTIMLTLDNTEYKFNSENFKKQRPKINETQYHKCCFPCKQGVAILNFSSSFGVFAVFRDSRGEWHLKNDSHYYFRIQRFLGYNLVYSTAADLKNGFIAHFHRGFWPPPR